MPGIVRFGPFEANLDTGELRKKGVHLALQPQPFEVLSSLVERPGALVTREQLHQRLWPGHALADLDHGLNNAVNKLRSALDDDEEEQPRYIETLLRRGYRFIAPVMTTAAVTNVWRGASRVLFEGRTISLPFGAHTIGRDETASSTIDSQTVSRLHVRLVLTQAYALVEDLGSKNGTRLNGKVLSGSAALADGDRIQVGTAVLRFGERPKKK